ncbi:DNA-directed RNA polymerase III subunit rpc25 [Pichia californica]|nr:DNA-directed RNA polymerase III subunit rpc25 [[Candida] californica]
MFQLTLISDLIRIPPHLFNLPRELSIKQELNVKHANKIIPKLGLVISIFDLIEYDTGLFRPGDGAMYVTVKCRLLVFKPFVGEIIQGWIEKCTADGIKLNIGFFNDIFIPKALLFENSHFSIDENAWIWKMDEDTTLYLDVNEKINFRIEEEIFTNVKPKGPISVIENTTNSENEKEQTPPYAIIASCQTDGMGCCSWWE